MRNLTNGCVACYGWRRTGTPRRWAVPVEGELEGLGVMNLLAQDRTRNWLRRPWKWPLRGAWVALLVVSALAAMTGTASAVIVHLANGKTLSYQPLRGGGHGRTLRRILLEPRLQRRAGDGVEHQLRLLLGALAARPPTRPTTSRGVNQYFEDLAHDSGGHRKRRLGLGPVQRRRRRIRQLQLALRRCAHRHRSLPRERLQRRRRSA